MNKQAVSTERSKDTPKGWNIKDFLSDLIGFSAETTPKARSEIWASDLGLPMIDRYLQMKGIPYSNPATGKDLLAFFLGKQIETGLVEMLTSCGVAYEAQDKITIKEKDCLPVVGRPDLILAVDDWDAVLAGIDDKIVKTVDRHSNSRFDKQMELRRLMKQWQKRYPQGLKKTVFEIKSINSAAFRYHRNEGGLANAYPHHKLQLYTYMKGLGLEEGHLVYVAKDTGWMEEVVVRPTESLKSAWLSDVRSMSEYYLHDQIPPLEPVKIDGKNNWRVAYSRYRDYLYQKGGQQ
jgi:hypothetical protein